MGSFLLRKVGAALIVIVLASMLVFARRAGAPRRSGARARRREPRSGGARRDPPRLRPRPAAADPVRQLGRPRPARRPRHRPARAARSRTRSCTRLPITLELAGLAILFGSVIGIVAGVIAAVRRGKAVGLRRHDRRPRRALRAALLARPADDHPASRSTCSWLPAGGYVPFSDDPVAEPRAHADAGDRPRHGLSAVVMRQMRSSMLDSLGADYVRTARAKGLSERSVVGKHALRNSLITVTTIIGLQLGALISGAVITEQIFGIAGFGRLTIDAVQQRDYALIQGVVLVAAVGYVVVNLLVDVVYSLLNPRIRIVARPSCTVVETHRRRLSPARPPPPARPQAPGPRPAALFRASPSRRSSSSPRSSRRGRAVLRLAPRISTRAREAVLGPPARHRRARTRHPLAHHLGGPRVDPGRRARHLPRDGDRRADRARRRVLPRLDRPGDLARDRRVLAFPFLILAVGLAAILGPSLLNATIALGVGAAPG